MTQNFPIVSQFPLLQRPISRLGRNDKLQKRPELVFVRGRCRMHHHMHYQCIRTLGTSGPLWPCQTEKGLCLLNACLSDRMSRSEMALLLPSRPTASQVMMADIENGIFETKNLHIFAVCCEWARWALHVARLTAGRTFFHRSCVGGRGWLYNGSCGANPPPNRQSSRAPFGVHRPNLTGSIGNAPVALFNWHSTATSHAWPERAATGLIGRQCVNQTPGGILAYWPFKTLKKKSVYRYCN